MNAKESEVFDEPSTTDSQVAERASQIEINTLIANAQRSDMFINPEGKQNLEQGYYDALQYLLRQLPDKLRASTLFEAFDEHFGWSEDFHIYWQPLSFLIYLFSGAVRRRF